MDVLDEENVATVTVEFIFSHTSASKVALDQLAGAMMETETSCESLR